uniref:Protein kinase domain-containing protein n=1 Tax=Chlamydomonas leiostraca TaxID=1034604 RepID=A0A7S0RFM9_9CHLO
MPQKRLRRCEEQQEGVQEKQQLGQQQEGQQEGPELGVQGLFSRLIQKSPGLFHVHDVHRTKSVCLDMKPDCVVSCTAHCMPIDTVLILDLKGQSESRKEYCRASHIYQLACYGVKLLEQLPAVCRSHVLLAVTDLRRIRFLRVTRKPGGDGYGYELSEEMEEVIPALCAVLLSEPSKYGAAYPPELTHDGEQVQLESFLGAGATSSVYRCSAAGQVGHVVAKVVRPAFQELADIEKDVLESLAGTPGVPALVGKGVATDSSPFLLLKPQGTTFAEGSSALELRRVALGVGQLVDALHAAHDKRIVHRDVRPDNIMVDVDVEDATWYIIDWGCAVRIPMAPTPVSGFCGTIRYASDRVLQLMASGGLLDASPADDLQSLVKALFVLSHPLERMELQAEGQPDAGGLLGVWRRFMQGRSMWSRLMDAAARSDYDVVRTGLVERFE